VLVPLRADPAKRRRCLYAIVHVPIVDEAHDLGVRIHRGEAVEVIVPPAP